jgi:GNAT superfamily N-acetyltransferase
VHRVALADAWIGKGLSHLLFDFIEDHARSLRLPRIKADTNFDNPAVLHLFGEGYRLCLGSMKPVVFSVVHFYVLYLFRSSIYCC